MKNSRFASLPKAEATTSIATNITGVRAPCLELGRVRAFHGSVSWSVREVVQKVTCLGTT